MRAALRSSDVKCRYGGDEFLVILPETPITGARQVCETLRRSIEKEPIAWADGAVMVTASFGVTEISPGENDPLADRGPYRRGPVPLEAGRPEPRDGHGAGRRTRVSSVLVSVFGLRPAN